MFTDVVIFNYKVLKIAILGFFVMKTIGCQPLNRITVNARKRKSDVSQIF